MQPILCKGGYGLPIKTGKFTICHIRATVDNPNQDSNLTLVDNSANNVYAESSMEYPSKTASTKYDNRRIANIKGIGGVHGTLEAPFPGEGLKVVDGISISQIDNISAGNIFVYVR